MKADPQTEAEVADVLARFVASLCDTDADAFVSLFAPDADVVALGTGEDEVRIGLQALRAQRERDIAQSESMSIELLWLFDPKQLLPIQSAYRAILYKLWLRVERG